jgi:hypothetical protein
MGEKEPGRDAQLRERGGIWYGALERGGGGLAAGKTRDQWRWAAVGMARE